MFLLTQRVQAQAEEIARLTPWYRRSEDCDVRKGESDASQGLSHRSKR